MKDPQPATSIDICNITSIDARFASMEDRLKSYEDMHERFTSPIMRYLDTLSTQMMNVQKDIGKLNDQHDFQEEGSTSIDRFRRTSLDGKKPIEHLPYTAAKVDQITSKLYTAIDTLEGQLEKRYISIDRQSTLQFDQHEISASIDRAHSKSINSKAPATIDIHLVASINTTSTPNDEQLIQNKMESMQKQLNELSAYAYDNIGWYQFNIEDILERLQNISNAVQKMDERWTRNDEATRRYARPLHLTYHAILGHLVYTDDECPEGHWTSLDGKKPTEHLPYTAAEVDQITSKLYTAIDTLEERLEKRCDDIYFPFDVKLNGIAKKNGYKRNKIGWHQFSIDDILEMLQIISNAVQKMDERWTRNDEATRSFIAAWMITNISTVDETSTSIDVHTHDDRCIPMHIDRFSLRTDSTKMLKWINMSTIHTCIDCLKELKLTSNTKPDIIACLGAWYTWDRILQTSLEVPDTCLKSLHPVIDTPKVNLMELGNDLGYIAACHCGAEYETEYSESIDTHTVSSIDSNETPTTDERYPTSLDGKQPVDHFTSTDQWYPDFVFQQPNTRGRDDYSIGSWADSGFHESFAVETVILSSNEDPTEEYDEDYWKERTTEIAMQDERYSTHSFNNTSPPSIDRVYSASIDTHPHPANRSSASIDTSPGTSSDIKAAAFEKEKGNIPIPNRDSDGHARAMDGRILQMEIKRPTQQELVHTKRADLLDQALIDKVASRSLDRVTPTSLDIAHSPSIDRRYECGHRAYDIYGARKFKWEQKDEYGVYRDESRYARSVAGEMIPVTKDNIRKIMERASLFEESHICLPEHATSFTPTRLTPKIYTKDEINEMVTGICRAQKKLGDELKTLVDDTYQPLDRGYNELFRSMEEMRT
ncbi:hypothetical protein F2Q69_00050340 [Brassica cretica]|uniref:Uncharacterized protein n=1 Tax=Brassica cretica TaxID=69181 RepID=A0A8S9PZQ7_BRACR|nr:hypothetical protein F2Q69_00050340 [Brassica cretica]